MVAVGTSTQQTWYTLTNHKETVWSRGVATCPAYTMTEQLTFFDNTQIVEKSGITMFRCDVDATRWITPSSLCPMCYPSQEVATCDTCGSEFTDSRYMVEKMRIGGDVRCDICLPRVSFDDCRDQNQLHREAEEIRQEHAAREQAVRKLRPVVFHDDE